MEAVFVGEHPELTFPFFFPIINQDIMAPDWEHCNLYNIVEIVAANSAGRLSSDMDAAVTDLLTETRTFLSGSVVTT